MLKALKNVTCKIELTTSSIIYDKLFQRHGDNSSFYGYYQVSQSQPQSQPLTQSLGFFNSLTVLAHAGLLYYI